MYFNIGNMIEGDINCKKWQKIQNSNVELLCFYLLMNEALEQFEWGGDIPETCDMRFFELGLLTRGIHCFYDDKNMGMISPMCGIGGMLNMYMYPTNLFITTYGTTSDALKLNGKMISCYAPGSPVESSEGVMCRDNDMYIPYILYIFQYAHALADCLSSIMTAAKLLKLPWILKCPEPLKTTVKNLLNSIDDNDVAIIASMDNLQLEKVEIFNTNANPEILKSLWNHFDKTFNQFKALMGIQNQQQIDKEERLLVGELQAGNESTCIMADMRLRCRKMFCEDVKKVFGININVKLRHKHTQKVEGGEDDVISGGTNDTE